MIVDIGDMGGFLSHGVSPSHRGCFNTVIHDLGKTWNA